MHHPQAASRNDAAQASCDILARLRTRGPRVHCITNSVAQAFTANVLLAVGAIPSMTLSPREVSDFSARADALGLGSWRGAQGSCDRQDRVHLFDAGHRRC